MSELFFSILLWCFPAFIAYLLQLIFMSLIVPSKLHRFWQYPLLALAISFFNLPKVIYGAYSMSADVFRLLSMPIVLIAVPILFFDAPLWKRLLTNLLLIGGQVIGEILALVLLCDLDLIRISNTAFSTFNESVVYTIVGLFANILVDSCIVIFSRTMKAKRFSGIYLPVILIILCLSLNYYAYISASNMYFWYVCILLSGVSIVFLLYYVVSLEKKTMLEQELQNIHYTMELEQTHYKAVEERCEEFAKIRHDFNNQLSTIHLLIQSGEKNDAHAMLKQLGEDITSTSDNVYCSIPVVNAVLTEKESLCRNVGITLHTALELPEALAIEPLHMCSILSNLIDNAVRGCSESEQPIITLSSSTAGDYLFLRTVNPAKLPQKPKSGHGYGSKILKELAKRYDGSYETSYENGIFTAVISLVFQNG